MNRLAWSSPTNPKKSCHSPFVHIHAFFVRLLVRTFHTLVINFVQFLQKDMQCIRLQFERGLKGVLYQSMSQSRYLQLVLIPLQVAL